MMYVRSEIYIVTKADINVWLPSLDMSCFEFRNSKIIRSHTYKSSSAIDWFLYWDIKQKKIGRKKYQNKYGFQFIQIFTLLKIFN